MEEWMSDSDKMRKEIHVGVFNRYQEPPEVEVVQMIRVTCAVGDGVSSPFQPVHRYYTMDGKFVMSTD
jgi:hypothetical protein